MRLKLCTRAAVKRIAIASATLTALTIGACTWMTSMPGPRFSGPLPPATESQAALAASLRADVERLASGVGTRSLMNPRKRGEVVAWLMDQLTAAGYQHIEEVWNDADESPTPTLEVTVPGTSLADQITVIGAHYDSYYLTPGADDNATGVAGTLELARRFAHSPCPRTIRFLFFQGEEPPAFQTPQMGSWHYAKRCRARNDNIVAMLALESIGYYDTRRGSQSYPFPFSLVYPSTGDFIAFIGNTTARPLVRRTVRVFRENTRFPSEGAAVPGDIAGVGWSDHWSFWQEGYVAAMVSGTATFRNPNYHQPTDTPDTLDYDRLSRVIQGLEPVVRDLATTPDLGW